MIRFTGKGSTRRIWINCLGTNALGRVHIRDRNCFKADDHLIRIRRQYKTTD